MLGVLAPNVFDAEVVDNQSKDDTISLVREETLGMLRLLVNVFGGVFVKAVIGNLASLR
jgi:hypothetical protein